MNRTSKPLTLAVSASHYLANGKRSRMEPEHHLWRRVLKMALQDVTGKGPRFRDYGRDHRASAQRWIESSSDDPGSFNFVCKVLDLDADFLRERVINNQRNIT